jgi:tetratricopeptide (TPR) repeat protein
MIPKRLLISFVICHLSIVICFSQGQRFATQNKKAEKLFYSAIDSYQAKNYDKAMGELKRAVELDPLFTEAYILQGDISADNKQFEKAIDFYNLAIKTNNPFSPNLYQILANLQLRVGRYTESRSNFQRFLEFDQIPEQKKKQAENGIKACEFAIGCIAHPVPFAPVNLGDSINTIYNEYVNAITPDDELLYFTRLNPKDNRTFDQRLIGEEDFYFANRIDSAWSKALNLGPPINSNGNEGALCISPDGMYIFLQPATALTDMAGAISIGPIGRVTAGRCPKTLELLSIHHNGIPSHPSHLMAKRFILQVTVRVAKEARISGKPNFSLMASGVYRSTLAIRSIHPTKK